MTKTISGIQVIFYIYHSRFLHTEIFTYYLLVSICSKRKQQLLNFMVIYNCISMTCIIKNNIILYWLIINLTGSWLLFLTGLSLVYLIRVFIVVEIVLELPKASHGDRISEKGNFKKSIDENFEDSKTFKPLLSIAVYKHL